jgi:hypothetical protein
VLWFNFQAFSDAIDEALVDPRGSVSEEGRFLLRELQALLIQDGLLDSDDVAVVAARVAYPEYLRHHAYVCQPNRAFRQGLTHMGFYAESAIQPHFPRILRHVDVVPFTADGAALREHRARQPTGREGNQRSGSDVSLATAKHP